MEEVAGDDNEARVGLERSAIGADNVGIVNLCVLVVFADGFAANRKRIRMGDAGPRQP